MTRSTWQLFAVAFLGAAVALALEPAAHRVRHAAHRWSMHREWRTLPAAANDAAWICLPAQGFEGMAKVPRREADLHRRPGLWIAPGGAIVVYAHRDLEGREFEPVRPGHPIIVIRPDGSRARYSVRERETIPRERLMDRLRDARDDRWLILVTCHPFRWTGPAPNRLLVWARRDTWPG